MACPRLTCSSFPAVLEALAGPCVISLHSAGLLRWLVIAAIAGRRNAWPHARVAWRCILPHARWHETGIESCRPGFGGIAAAHPWSIRQNYGRRHDAPMAGQRHGTTASSGRPCAALFQKNQKRQRRWRFDQGNGNRHRYGRFQYGSLCHCQIRPGRRSGSSGCGLLLASRAFDQPGLYRDADAVGLR